MAIIAFSHQIGSHGAKIASKLADALGYHLVSQNEIHQMAVECDDEFQKACKSFENEVPLGFWDRFFFDRPSNASLFEAMIYELASRENVIIMGRGSQVVLKDIEDVFRVRVVAPFDLRGERISAGSGMSLPEARQYVERKDRQSRSLVETVYHVDLGEWHWYDLILNTERLDVDHSVRIVSDALAGRPEADTPRIKAFLDRMSTAKKAESAVRREVPGLAGRDIVVDSPSMGDLVMSGMVHSQSAKDRAEEIVVAHAEGMNLTNDLVVVPYFDE